MKLLEGKGSESGGESPFVLDRVKGEVSAFPMETGVNLIVVDTLDVVVTVVLVVPIWSEVGGEKEEKNMIFLYWRWYHVRANHAVSNKQLYICIFVSKSSPIICSLVPRKNKLVVSGLLARGLRTKESGVGNSAKEGGESGDGGRG